jgi:LacI family transcriptional regulator
MASPLRVGLALEIHLLFKNHTDIFAGVQRFADEAGWLTIIDDWVQGTLAAAARGQARYDGVIARVDARRRRLVKAAARAGVPVVNILASSPAVRVLPGVFPDIEKIGSLQAEHLMSRGLRRFAFLRMAERPDEDLLVAGFTASVQAAGHTVTTLALPANANDSLAQHRRTQDRIKTWMNAWKLPLGAATASDTLSRLLAQIAHERGWRVPEDVAIIGARNEEHLCERPRPCLSSIDIGYERIGYEAAQMLDRLMRGETMTGVPRIAVPPVGVVARESTNFYAADDPLVAEAQALIAQQCHTHLEVTDVAKQLCVSPKTLQLHFAAALRRSVAQEIRRVRIEKVKRELSTSDLSIHEIAKRAGFPSNTRLSEVFKREVGMTPSEFRGERSLRKA